MNSRSKFSVPLNLSSLRQRIQEVAGLETKQPIIVEMQDFSRKAFDRENEDIDLTVNLVDQQTQENTENIDCDKEAGDLSTENTESEKDILIRKIVELQRTVEDVENKVIKVRQQNAQLEAENLVISDYILNLMRTSDTFQHLND
eukprot:TRINITY_DN6240_c0_g1_i12.p1 TRINITY_DN6240_c0_g1~~TRINITY_DN6240_c0_g1_i12.p1  ORF type:complete len:145 (-),score=30.04 TRINITY_DN6240_c0_g1_i12:156-590(-)